MNRPRLIINQLLLDRYCRALLVLFALNGLFSIADNLKAQDIHFSQIDINPVLFNPAYAGFFDGDGRFGAVYRNQWATVSKPFQTFAASAELPIAHGRANSSGLNGGAVFATDRAGSLNYGSTSIQAILSYFFSISGRNDNFLSLALQGGFCQFGFDETGIALPEADESFAQTKVGFFTFGAGVAWFKQLNADLSLKIGVAALNLNQPSNSYFGDVQTRLSRRINVYARGEWQYWNRVSLMPIAGYQRQGTFNELFYGVDVRWYLIDSPRNYFAITGGIMYRHGDAAVLTAAIERGPFTFALSYDANVSRLAAASHTIGSFELGVVYRIMKPQARYRQLPCPII